MVTALSVQAASLAPSRRLAFSINWILNLFAVQAVRTETLKQLKAEGLTPITRDAIHHAICEVERAYGARVPTQSIRPRHFAQVTRLLRAFVRTKPSEIIADPALVTALNEAADRLQRCGIERHPTEARRLRIFRAELATLTGDDGPIYDLSNDVQRHYGSPDGTVLAEAIVTLATSLVRRGEVKAAAQLIYWALTWFDRWSFGAWLRLSLKCLPLLASIRPRLEAVSTWQRILRLQSRLTSMPLRPLREIALILSCDVAYGALKLNSRRRGSRLPPFPCLPKGLASAPMAPPPQCGEILVTRGMGGIGDLLMMTPGFRHLAAQYGAPVHLAIPRPLFVLFTGNPDVVLHDIAGPPIDVSHYKTWINLSNCPAAREEGRTLPHVTKNRIDVFAEAMGIKTSAGHEFDRCPRFDLLPEDIKFREEFWRRSVLDGHPVIGVQLRSADSYKDYPAMEHVVLTLAADENARVIVFDSEPVEGYKHPNVIHAAGLGLREALSLASGCDVLLAPDSAFVHFGPAVDVPTVAIFGPTDGQLFTRYYRNARVIDVRHQMDCIPCWRNEDSPCHRSAGPASVCLGSTPASAIIDAVRGIVAGERARRQKVYASRGELPSSAGGN